LIDWSSKDIEVMQLGNLNQNNNLILGRCKPCVGMMFASLLASISSGLSAQESTLPSPDEVTVFGSENRFATLHYFSSNLLKHLQNSPNQKAFNGLKQISPAVSQISTGEMAVEDERPNGLYKKYNDFSDTISMVIMAETLIIRSMMVKSGSLVT
jgi:hypothetical protein